MAGQGMARMIQMITALSEMQDRRRRLALDEDQFEAGKKQFAETMGFNKDNQHQAFFLKNLDRIAQGGAEGAVAAQNLANLPGFSPEEQQALIHAGPNASALLQQVQAQTQQYAQQQQQSGFNSMTPQMQQQAQQQAYLTNQANTSPGQMAVSNLTANLANTPISKDLAQRAGEGFVMRNATGQDPFSFNVGQSAIDQGMAPAAAGIQAGINPSWMNKAQDQYWRGSLLNDANALGVRANAATPRLAPADMASLMNTAHQIAKDLAEGKYANDNLKKHMMAQYNAMAPILGLPMMTDKNEPETTSYVGQAANKLTGMNYPGAQWNPVIPKTTTSQPDSSRRPPSPFNF